MSDIRSAFDRSAEANRELQPHLDGALIEVGRALSDQIDAATGSGSPEDAAKALYLAPHLMNVLREMFATPKARLDAGVGKEEARGRLAEVRDLRKRPAPSKKRAGA